MDEEALIEAQLIYLRRRRRLFVWSLRALLLTFMACVLAALLDLRPTGFFVATFVAGIATTLTGWLHGFSICPRCKKWFYVGWRGTRPFLKHCQGCGLPLGARKEP